MEACQLQMQDPLSSHQSMTRKLSRATTDAHVRFAAARWHRAGVTRRSVSLLSSPSSQPVFGSGGADASSADALTSPRHTLPLDNAVSVLFCSALPALGESGRPDAAALQNIVEETSLSTVDETPRRAGSAGPEYDDASEYEPLVPERRHSYGAAKTSPDWMHDFERVCPERMRTVSARRQVNRRKIALLAAQALFTVVMAVLSVWLHELPRSVALLNIRLWRWAVFAATVFPIVRASFWIARLFIKLAELLLRDVQNVTYILVDVAKPLRILVCVSLLQFMFEFLLSAYLSRHTSEPSPPPSMFCGAGGEPCGGPGLAGLFVADGDGGGGSGEGGGDAAASVDFIESMFRTARRLAICLNVWAVAEVIKALLTRILALRIHAETHFTKLEAALRKEWLLSMLTSNKMFAAKPEELGRGMGVPPDSAVTIMTMLQSQLASASKLTSGGTFVDHISRLTKQCDTTNAEDARMAGFFLWWNCRRDYTVMAISQEDFEPFFPLKADAADAFRLFDANGDGEVSYQEVVARVTEMYQERRNLIYTLMDTRSVLGMLKVIVGTVLHIAALFVYLIVFNVDVSHLALSLSSMAVATAFVFGNSLQNMYESLLFLFVTHPFDVGDRISYDGATHVVDEFGLFTTELIRWDGRKIWVPNSKLRQTDITNLTRSANLIEHLEVNVNMDTPGAALDAVRDAVAAVLEENPLFYTQNMYVYTCQLQAPLKCVVGVSVEYSFPGDNHKQLVAARGLVLRTMAETLTACGVRHSQYVQNYEQAALLAKLNSSE